MGVFKEKESAVLDIGSGHITLMLASKTNGDYCRVSFEAKYPYKGIENGTFLDFDDTKNCIKMCFNRLKEKHGRIKKIYVGIPAEFSVCRISSRKLGQIKHKKVEQIDIDTLISSSNPFSANVDKELISSNPIYFVIDGDDEKYIDPLGKVTKSLEARISNIAVSSSILEFLRSELKSNGIVDVEFVPSPLTEAISLFRYSERDSGVLLVDCGYKSTSLVVNCSDGLESMYSFSCGRYHIIDWMSQGLGIDFDEARILLEKVDFSLMPKDETYSVNCHGQLRTFSCKDVQQMAKECVRIICGYITKCINNIEDARLKNMTVYLTGSGLDFRGVESRMADFLGRPVKKVYPTFASNYKKASYSRVMGLLQYALK